MFCIKAGYPGITTDPAMVSNFLTYQPRSTYYLDKFSAALKNLVVLNRRQLDPQVKELIQGAKVHIGKGKVNKAKPMTKLLCPEEVQALIEALLEKVMEPGCKRRVIRASLLVILSYYGMYRASDANRLKLVNFRFEEDKLLIRSNQRKNDRFATRPMISVIAKKPDKVCPVLMVKVLLDKLGVDDENQYLFTNLSGQRIKNSTLYNDMKKTMKMLGVRATSLRSSAVARMVDMGVPQSTIQQVGGWRAVETVAIYAKNDVNVRKMISYNS